MLLREFNILITPQPLLLEGESKGEGGEEGYLSGEKGKREEVRGTKKYGRLKNEGKCFRKSGRGMRFEE